MEPTTTEPQSKTKKIVVETRAVFGRLNPNILFQIIRDPRLYKANAHIIIIFIIFINKCLCSKVNEVSAAATSQFEWRLLNRVEILATHCRRRKIEMFSRHRQRRFSLRDARHAVVIASYEMKMKTRFDRGNLRVRKKTSKNVFINIYIYNIIILFFVQKVLQACIASGEKRVV